MNAPERLPLPDIQSSPDLRRLPIQRVGIRDVRVPVVLQDGEGATHASVARVDMYVGLPAEQKGTHMSRFIEIIEAHGRSIAMDGFGALFERMLERLEAPTGYLRMRFPWFVRKAAPVSGVESLMDYDVTVTVEKRSAHGPVEQWLSVLVPVTSLCPCSKEISAYGAHNQRSHITIAALAALAAGPLRITDLIDVAERAASCQLWGLLKRPDEKYVTERAYENPKFVEDLVRDIALDLQRDARISAFSVESENFESIHNHSAYARIDFDARI